MDNTYANWKVRDFSFLLFLITLTLIACSPKEINPTDLIGTENCRPPCWNNIVPGETTETDALSILVEFEAQGPGEVEILPNDIRWRDLDNRNYYLNIQDGMVMTVNFRVFSLTVEDVIGIFGEPSGLSIYDIEREGYGILLYYPDIGILIGIGTRYSLSSSRSHYYIKPEMEIHDITY